MNKTYKHHTNEEKLAEFERLLAIMKRLRAECPWDREQTFESIRSNTVEEAYELSDAILSRDMHEIKKELGDLLLHIVFYSEMGSETEDFDIYDVCKSINEKLIFRHPHVFGEVNVNGDTAKVLENWENLKLKEKAFWAVFLPHFPHLSKRIGFRKRRQAWASTGNTANRFGTK